MIKIPLTRGRYCVVDSCDRELVSQLKWSASQRGSTWYATRSLRLPDGRKACEYLHTFLTGWPLVDHVNGDGLDNRRANLRLANQSQNNGNQRKTRRPTTSRYKGVHWAKRSQRWCAQIRVAGRRVSLGTFHDQTTAALAYDAAARKLSGEFAALNFPRPGERSALTRGESAMDIYAAAEPVSRPTKTRCANGHVRDDANTWVARDGRPRCRACARARHAKWLARHQSRGGVR